MKFKKLEKNILICSLSVVGIGAVVGTSLAITNEVKPKTEDPLLNKDFSAEVFQGTTLTKADLQGIGWDRKVSISLADWEKQAPNVTQLGNGDSISAPFYANNMLESIEIPTQITRINDSAFYSTPSLKRITFTNDSQLVSIGKKAFNNSGIEEISIPISVNSIGDEAFRNTTNLAPDKIFLPESVKGQSEEPLYGLALDQWESFKSNKATFSGRILDKNAVKSLGWFSKQEITLEDWKSAPNVVQISGESEIVSGADSAFQASTSLQKITIPARVQKINYSSFSRSSVKEVVFESGSKLKAIGGEAFDRSQLTTITIPMGLTTIGQRSFANSKLTSISIPHSVTTIARANAFQNTSATLPGSSIWMPRKFQITGTTYGFTSAQVARINWLDQYMGTTLGKAEVVNLGWNFKRTITLNDWLNDAPNVTILSGNPVGDNQGLNSAFSGNTILQSIEIPDKVTRIDFASFARTSVLSNVIFGKNSKLASIEEYAFDGSGIIDIIIPSEVHTIKHFAFTNTPRFNSINFEANSKLKLIQWSVFENSRIKSVYIPTSTGLVMNNDVFKNTTSLLGANVSMPDSLRGSAGTNKYGFNNTQWNAIKWRAPQFTGTVLTKDLVVKAGWDQKVNITLEDWQKDFPNVIEIGDNKVSTSDGSQGPFSFNNKLRYIVIPKRIKKLNYAAFRQSTVLETLTFENGSQLTDINDFVFKESNLSNFTMPDTVNQIGVQSFLDSKLQTIKLSSRLNWMNDSAFQGTRITSINIPRGVTQLRANIFRYTRELRTITFESGSAITSIGNYAFGDSGITSIQIPKLVRSLGRYSFLRTSNLRTFTFEEGSQLTTLGHGVFQNATFKTLVLPKSLTSVEAQSFAFSGDILHITMSSKLRRASLLPLYGLNDTQWRNINWVVEPFTGPTLTKNDVINLNWWDKPVISLADWGKDAPNVTSLGHDIVSGNINEAPFSNNTAIRDITIPSKVTTIGFNAFSGSAFTKITFQDGSRLAKIGTQAFDRSKITAINIPDSVTNIATDAFRSTTALAGAQISMSSKLRKGSLTGLYGFSDDQWRGIAWRIAQFTGTTLRKADVIDLNWHLKTDITQNDWSSLAPNVTKISEQATSGAGETAAFSNNTTLRTILIPAKVTEINFVSFYKTTNLRTITFATNSKLTTLGDAAFEFSGITEIRLPASLTAIPVKAFEEARGLKKVSFEPGSVLRSIGSRAFYSSFGLNTIEIPEKLTSIGDYAFWNSRITSLNLPNSVTHIGTLAFNGISTLEGSKISMLITLRTGPNTNYGFTQGQWNNIVWRTIPFRGTTLLKENVEALGWHLKDTITLADWERDAPVVTQISNHALSGDAPTAAFEKNTKLKSIQIPDRITKINFGTFHLTTVLQSVTFEAGSQLEFIGNATFRISSLNSITIPASVTEIGNHAFQESPQFREIVFANGSKLAKIGEGVFDRTSISAINVPDSVKSIGVDAFASTNSLQGQNVQMDIKLKQSSVEPKYGFLLNQWSKIAWRGNVTLTDAINTSFLVDFKENSNIVNLPALTPKYSTAATADAKDAGLSLQFAVGTTSTNLIAEWGTAAEVKSALATYSGSKSILKSEINIFARMYLPAGTGADNNMLGNVTYAWNKSPMKVYDSTTGIINNLFVTPGSSTLLTNKFIRAYSKINDNWSESLIAGGNKASAVKVTSADNIFDIPTYTALGVNLEVSVDNKATWTTITTFGTQVFNAAATNKAQFRLSVVDSKFSEIIGTASTIEQGTSPSGIRTTIIEKAVVAKKELTGILAANLVTEKLAVTGTTHNLNIVESPDLYAALGMNIATAKTIFEIKYSYDGSNYWNATAFTSELNKLRSEQLNGLNLQTFKVRYEFTAEGSKQYYSTEVANDPDAPESSTKLLNTSAVNKTIDLTSQIADIAKIQISGSTEAIVWTGAEFLTSLASLVKVEYGTYVRSPEGVVSYQWSIEMPTSLYTNTAPTGEANYPLAVRFVSKTEGAKEEIGSINSSGTFQPSNTTLGYKVDASKLVSVIRVNTTELVDKLIFTGVVNNLNNGESSTAIEAPAMALVDEIFRTQVVLKYQISTLAETWFSLDELKQYMTSYIGNYANETSGILIFHNATIAGVTIKAKFEAKDPSKFTVISSPNTEVQLNTSQIVTNIDLKGYVQVLQTQKVTPSGTSASDLGTLTFPSMTGGSVPFGGRTYEQIEAILRGSVDFEFKAPSFNGDAWVPLSRITSVNVNNELYIRFVVKPEAKTNISLSLVATNDWESHQDGFKLKLNLPIEIQVNSANLVKLITLSGNTKVLGINDDEVYKSLVSTNPDYAGKVKILYTIGVSPMHLDPDNLDKTEFTKADIIRLLASNIIDVTLLQKQITAKYELADGISADDYVIKDKTTVVLSSTSVALYINKSNYYELAEKLSVSGTSSGIVWGPEVSELTTALSKGLILQYSTDSAAKLEDPDDDSKWSTRQPTTINPVTKFLAVRFVVVAGYVFEETPKLFNVNTTNVLLVIELQSQNLELITLTGNTRNVTISTTQLDAALEASGIPGKEHLVIQYYFGGTPPASLGFGPGVEWFTATEITSIFAALQGAKDTEQLILFRNSLKARYSLNDKGYETYRMNIDGNFIDGKFPEQAALWKDLVTQTLNPTFEGYINLSIFNTFTADNFQVIGSDKKPQLKPTNAVGAMFDFYKDQTTVPFDIYYSKTVDNFTNTAFKLFDESGFITAFNPSFIIDLDSEGNPLPIYFKIVARNGYKIWENNVELPTGKVITITNFDIQPQITNPLKVPPTIKFVSPTNATFYQGQGSLSVYDSTSGALVDQAFLNAEYSSVVPHVLKLQYNASETTYTPEELEEVKADDTQWSDIVPTTLKVGQYVMVRVAINNDKFTLLGGDAMTAQVRVRGLKVRVNDLVISPNLTLTNTDIYGYAPLDGQTKIETATLESDPAGNYLGADLQMSVESEFYRDASGKIILDLNNIPIIKRDPAGAEQVGVYVDDKGNPIIDGDGKPIPIWTIKKGTSVIPAPPLKTGNWKPARKMIDWSVPGSFTQYDDGVLDWRLFEGQVVRFSFIARVGQGTTDSPDFIFDTPATKMSQPEITLSTIKYIIPTQGINYRFDQAQLKDITFASDDDQEDPFTGASHISSPLKIARITPDYKEEILVGTDIENQVKTDFEDRVQIKMQLAKQNGTTSSAFGSNIEQFTGLQNGDILTISFESKDINFSLPKPIPPLTIVIKGLFVKPLDVNLFKNLRPDFTGSLNGSGAFSIKVTNPSIPTETNETVLGLEQWYEYQVWSADKQLKTAWTRDETKINNLVNGDKVEWKLVNKDGVFVDDYYNTLLANTENPEDIKFRVVNVQDKIEQTVQEGIGSSAKLNPDLPGGIPVYPENSGWVVSGLKIEITLDAIQQQKFEQALAQFQPTFSGVDKFGSMSSNILNDVAISQDIVIVWYASGEDGMPRRITDFKDAGLSNGDQVWASIAPSQHAIDNNLIIDESISQMSSKVFVVEGLTTIVNSTTQTLMISLITASSVLLIGTIGVIVFMRKNGKLGGNKKFKL